MKVTVAALTALLAILVLALSSPPASAFDEMTGVSMSFSPTEMNGGASTHMVVSLHNANNRSLTVTTITIQIYEGAMWGSMDKYTMYHSNPDDAVVPAGGSKDFAIDGNAPGYVGPCTVLVTIGGLFEGDENASVGILSSSTMIQPGFGFMNLGLLIIVVVSAIVGVVVLAVILVSRKRTPPSIQRSCPRCGAPVPPGSIYCTGCGRKL